MAKQITAQDLTSTAKFNAYLVNTVKSDNSLANRIQVLLDAAFIQYENDNPNWFTSIMTAGFKATRLAAIQKYVEDHTELLLGKNKAGEKAFVYSRRPGFVYKKPVETWYDYSSEGMEIKTFDFNASIKGLVTRAKKALKGDGYTIKEGQEAQIRAFLQAQGMEA